MGEKAQHEEEMERAKEMFKNALMAILTQCKSKFSFLTRLTDHMWQIFTVTPGVVTDMTLR